jgi:hypothetical protein
MRRIDSIYFRVRGLEATQHLVKRMIFKHQEHNVADRAFRGHFVFLTSMDLISILGLYVTKVHRPKGRTCAGNWPL